MFNVYAMAKRIEELKENPEDIIEISKLKKPFTLYKLNSKKVNKPAVCCTSCC
ncbi:hypothetical protein [Halobacillus massiliensis]|uniref:hypothetical protein n=1 Tax=Halobacillus massiliensis TaxID=1926286 RepID=UPI0015C4CF15|nr:hypothetical protein [Halobacillus massiliensis]